MTPVNLGSETASDDIDGPLTPAADNTGPFPIETTGGVLERDRQLGKPGNGDPNVTETATLYAGDRPCAPSTSDLHHHRQASR